MRHASARPRNRQQSVTLLSRAELNHRMAKMAESIGFTPPALMPHFWPKARRGEIFSISHHPRHQPSSARFRICEYLLVGRSAPVIMTASSFFIYTVIEELIARAYDALPADENRHHPSCR